MKLKNAVKSAKSGFQSFQNLMAQGHGTNFRVWIGSIALGQLVMMLGLVLASGATGHLSSISQASGKTQKIPVTSHTYGEEGPGTNTVTVISATIPYNFNPFNKNAFALYNITITDASGNVVASCRNTSNACSYTFNNPSNASPTFTATATQIGGTGQSTSDPVNQRSLGQRYTGAGASSRAPSEPDCSPGCVLLPPIILENNMFGPRPTNPTMNPTINIGYILPDGSIAYINWVNGNPDLSNVSADVLNQLSGATVLGGFNYSISDDLINQQTGRPRCATPDCGQTPTTTPYGCIPGVDCNPGDPEYVSSPSTSGQTSQQNGDPCSNYAQQGYTSYDQCWNIGEPTGTSSNSTPGSGSSLGGSLANLPPGGTKSSAPPAPSNWMSNYEQNNPWTQLPGANPSQVAYCAYDAQQTIHDPSCNTSAGGWSVGGGGPDIFGGGGFWGGIGDMFNHLWWAMSEL